MIDSNYLQQYFLGISQYRANSFCNIIS